MLDQMLSIYRQGLGVLDLGVSVQELLRLPLLASARRLKGTYSNSQVEALHQFAAGADAEFARLANEYAQQGKARQ